MKKILLALTLLTFTFACSKQEKALTDEELREKANKLAQQYIIVDGHVDLPYRMQVGGFMIQKKILDVSKRTKDGNFDYPRSKEGGLNAPFMSIYTPSSYQKTGGSKALADSLIEMTKKIATQWPDKFAMAYSPDDILKNFKEGKVSLPMGMENGAPVENNIEDVNYYYEQGIRYITLTHALDNKICDSSYDTTGTHGGLSEYGKEVVAEMNRVGIMVDISHVSDNAFHQVMEVTKAPVIASHSSARKFTPGFERNMSDDLIKKLAQNNGVIMINFGGDFLNGEFRKRMNKYEEHIINWLADNELERSDEKAREYIAQYLENNNPFADITEVADHIDHVVSLTGNTDHIGFGSDFDGVGDSLPNGLKDVSMYPNLIYELLKRGYTDEDIEKMCYKNLFRVWRKVEEVAANS